MLVPNMGLQEAIPAKRALGLSLALERLIRRVAGFINSP